MSDGGEQSVCYHLCVCVCVSHSLHVTCYTKLPQVSKVLSLSIGSRTLQVSSGHEFIEASVHQPRQEVWATLLLAACDCLFSRKRCAAVHLSSLSLSLSLPVSLCLISIPLAAREAEQVECVDISTLFTLTLCRKK